MQRTCVYAKSSSSSERGGGQQASCSPARWSEEASAVCSPTKVRGGAPVDKWLSNIWSPTVGPSWQIRSCFCEADGCAHSTPFLGAITLDSWGVVPKLGSVRGCQGGRNISATTGPVQGLQQTGSGYLTKRARSERRVFTTVGCEWRLSSNYWHLSMISTRFLNKGTQKKH